MICKSRLRKHKRRSSHGDTKERVHAYHTITTTNGQLLIERGAESTQVPQSCHTYNRNSLICFLLRGVEFVSCSWASAILKEEVCKRRSAAPC
ncbi:hypothetical protein HBI56_021290 [Parastagonospora nodorum]|uniref:Uncharacterized protein n=1 Tax=Phaeosphaeria nodorum (strain SN15 / ATCC MYA-4574 / FGSC 10173) TaxID=321614 RepID=A0A7U2F0C7_PHANO|nr:hypothetical protein HBH56_174260 [Parastagonospora nodorum]QRC96370.1 hypothetical protein JI435_408850 [Parastagonospora nodorum SN15]KAH3926456.1 hypothetical protein HBH54_168870 [Parastagonospora nodorum]KAH3955283.1 hypothetical protein HBH53_001700 [Parastagonospora nodorum]KAH3971424.1 hypothetical protein HBH51_111230 [Parastagonospora nodorum]